MCRRIEQCHTRNCPCPNTAAERSWLGRVHLGNQTCFGRVVQILQLRINCPLYYDLEYLGTFEYPVLLDSISIPEIPQLYLLFFTTENAYQIQRVAGPKWYRRNQTFTINLEASSNGQMGPRYCTPGISLLAAGLKNQAN